LPFVSTYIMPFLPSISSFFHPPSPSSLHSYCKFFFWLFRLCVDWLC
jgi:hypothetical protein